MISGYDAICQLELFLYHFDAIHPEQIEQSSDIEGMIAALLVYDPATGQVHFEEVDNAELENKAR